MGTGRFLRGLLSHFNPHQLIASVLGDSALDVPAHESVQKVRLRYSDTASRRRISLGVLGKKDIPLPAIATLVPRHVDVDSFRPEYVDGQ
jgi:hypothetical protein